jgi:serine protease Do
MQKRSAVALLAVALMAAVAGSQLYALRASPQGTPPQTPFVAKDLVSFRDVVKHVLPAVVSIESTGKAPVVSKAGPKQKAPAGNLPIPEEFRKFFREMPEGAFQFGTPQFGTPQPRRSFGSGVIVDPKGVVLTNFHVVQGADRVQVSLTDGRKFTSKVIKSDPKTDLAIVRLDTRESLPYLKMGDSDAMEIGDRVLAVGAPFGMAGSVTHGIVSAKGRNLDLNAYEDFIQTDAAINPGNSGGPLVNLKGEIIGINSVIKTRTGGFQGVGLAISSKLAKRVMEQLETNGVVRRGFLGVQVRELDPAVAARLGAKDKAGVLVAAVEEGAPAAKAGLKEGDVLTKLAGHPVFNVRQLQHDVANLAIGKQVDLTVLRDGQPHQLRATVEQQPTTAVQHATDTDQPSAENGSAVAVDKFGLKLGDLTPEHAKELGFRKNVQGALVTGVDQGSAAEQAGLRPGTVIVKVENRPVRDAQSAAQAIQKGSAEQGVLLHMRSPGQGLAVVMLRASKE